MSKSKGLCKVPPNSFFKTPHEFYFVFGIFISHRIPVAKDKNWKQGLEARKVLRAECVWEEIDKAFPCGLSSWCVLLSANEFHYRCLEARFGEILNTLRRGEGCIILGVTWYYLLNGWALLSSEGSKGSDTLPAALPVKLTMPVRSTHFAHLARKRNSLIVNVRVTTGVWIELIWKTNSDILGSYFLDICLSVLMIL